MNATHNVKIGQIFSMSWGYDQTNVNYFQVVSLTAKGVYVREIGACSVPDTQGFMSEDVKPNKDRFLDRFRCSAVRRSGLWRLQRNAAIVVRNACRPCGP